jgi:hypothetical protein
VVTPTASCSAVTGLDHTVVGQRAGAVERTAIGNRQLTVIEYGAEARKSQRIVDAAALQIERAGTGD